MKPSTVFITGASSGIGKALALEYAAGGAHVALAARREGELEEVARDVRAKGARALVVPLDVADPVAVKNAVQRAEREMGSLDMCIANAGRGDPKHAASLTYDDVAQLLAVNLAGACATLLAAAPIMIAQRSGQLVGITSLAGRRGLPLCAAYSATKAGLSAFIDALRIDLGPAGVRVTDVQPGFVLTEAMQQTAQGKAPTPFAWPVEKAARHIVRKLERAPAMIAFPWQLALATRFARHLPAWIYDPIMRGNVKAE
jgi:short-subunit dehydrogenase